MKLMVLMIVALSLSSTTWAQGQHTQTGRKSEPMQTMNDITMVAPALEKYAWAKRATSVEQQFGGVAQGIVQYTTDVLFRDLWLRPDLAPRDRSLVTVSALIASGQVAQITYHLNRAMDNGLTQTQAAEMV